LILSIEVTIVSNQ